MALSELDKAILDFERIWWTCDGPKADLVRERFGIDADEYHRRLGALLDEPSALDHDPLVVRRLQRMRARKRRERLGSSGGHHNEEAR